MNVFLPKRFNLISAAFLPSIQDQTEGAMFKLLIELRSLNERGSPTV